MPSPVDLDHRLRSAAGRPDTERALAHVMRRIRRRTRQRVLAVITLVAVASGLVGVWLLDRQEPEKSSIVAGDPPRTTVSPRGEPDFRPQRLWSAPGVGMSDSFGASGGRLAISVGDAVFAAEGFGIVGVEPVGRVTALDRGTGGVRWAAQLGGPAFLQGAAGGTVIASTQHDRVVGLDAANGTVRWEIGLPGLGLGGYGAITSAVTESITAIGLSASKEGDVRPPVVLGVDTRTGEVAWATALVEGTDLMWGIPPVSAGETVFASTLSHPGGAGENVAHLLDLTDGSIRWAAGMGGSEGFSDHPAVFNGRYVHLPAHPDVLTVDRQDGSRRWARSGRGALLMGAELWVTASEGSLELVDPVTGEVVREQASPIGQPRQLVDLGGGLLGVVGRTQFAAVDRDGRVTTRQTWDSPLVDVVFDRGLLVVATANQAITAYVIETSALPDAEAPLPGQPFPELEAAVETILQTTWSMPAETAGRARVSIDAGRVTIDLGRADEVLAVQPNLGSSAATSFLMRPIHTAAFAFPQVETVQPRISGSSELYCDYVEIVCEPLTRSEWATG